MKKVVSATLAGALAVGMVPAMALADEIQLLDETTATIADDMVGATISVYEGGLASGHVFTYNGKAQALVPAEIIGGVSKVDYEVVKYYYFEIGNDRPISNVYFADGTPLEVEGQKALDGAPVNIGKYAVVAYASNSDYAQVCGTFSIVGQSLEDAEVNEVHIVNGETVVDDTVITWNNAARVFDTNGSLAEDDLVLKIGEAVLDGDDFSIAAIYNSKNVRVWKAGDGNANMPSAAGTYTMEIEGKGAAYAGQKAEIEYTIEQLNLNDANVQDAVNKGIYVKNDQPYLADLTINGDAYGAGFVLSHTKNAINPNAMTLTVEVDPANPTFKANAYGTATIDYIVVDKLATVVGSYDEVAFDGDGDVDLLVGSAKDAKKKFDPELITAKADGKPLAEGKYDIVVKKEVDGDLVDASVEDLVNETNAGIYRVYVAVNAAAVDYAYAGVSSDYMTVQVDHGDITHATVAYVYNGTALKTSSYKTAYNGTDIASKLEAIVETDEGVELVEGKDYTVVITTVIKGKTVVVDEAVDAGVYTYTIKSDKYQIVGDTTFTLTIDDADVTPVKVNEFGQYDAIASGKAIDPIDYFYTMVGTKKVEMDVPASAYKVTIDDFDAENPADQPKKTPTEVKAAGTYKITITDAKVDADNWDVEETTFTFVVTSKPVFADIKADAWYADEVYAVAAAGVMTGYGAGIFGPTANADREEVAVMMSRLAKLVNPGFIDEDWTDTNGGDQLVLPFDDFDGGAWYAQGVYNMYKLGVMGVNMGDEYGIDRDITRAELITALYRFDAKGLGILDDTILPQASAFDAYVDGDEVPAWAVEAMEWGIEKGLIGVDTAYLNADDPIIRAELAAIFARYMDMIEWDADIDNAANGQ